MDIENEELLTQDDETVDSESIETQLREALQEADPGSVEQEAQEHEPEAESYKAEFDGYSEDQKALLATIPPDIQKIIDDRAAKFHNGIEKYKSESEFARTIDRVLSPDKEALERVGLTKDQYLTNLVNTERQLRSSDPMTKLQALHAIAIDYGIDLNVATQVPFDQRAYQIERENIRYKDQIAAQEYNEHHSSAEQLEELIDNFRAGHEHFDELGDEIFKLLQNGLVSGDTPEQRLADAYDKAARLNDNVYQKISAKTQIQQQAVKANTAAQAAKKTAVQVKGAPVGVVKTGKVDTVQDAVYSAFDALGM